MPVLYAALDKWQDKFSLVSGRKVHKWLYNFCKLHLGYCFANNEVLTLLQMDFAVLFLFRDTIVQRLWKVRNCGSMVFHVLVLTRNLRLPRES